MKQALPFWIILTIFISSCNNGSQEPDFYLDRSEIDERIEEILSRINEPAIPSDTLDLIEFCGQKPGADELFNYQPYINAAIDSLNKKGGGWLHISADQPIRSWMRSTKTYRIEGPLFMKSNVGILIDRSVRLFFPFNPESFLDQGKGVLTRYEGTTIYSFSPLFRAFNVENIAIRGNGNSGALPVIDGDGEKWQEWMWTGETNRRTKGLKGSYQLIRDINNADLPIKERLYSDPEMNFFRPEMMEFFLCKNVLVEGIQIENSPFWCIKPVFSSSCIFRDLRFDASCVNNDGIDPESSKDILIENIMFGNHDDNVAIKAGRDKEGRNGALVAGTELEDIESEYINNGRITGPTENVVIRNCHFFGHHAICIGSEMSGGVRGIYAVDNYSVKEVNMGLFIKSSRLRGGTVEDVYINGLYLNECKSEVISIIPNYQKADDKPYPPLFRNIQIENISSMKSKQGIVIHGWPDKPVKNVIIKNAKLENVSSNPLVIEQADKIHLDKVIINSEMFDEEYSRVDSTDLPPIRK